MKDEVISVRDPVWANPQRTMINCYIRTSTYSEELPFTASVNDPAGYGQELFRRCANGEFGEVEPYCQPPEGESDHSGPVAYPKWIEAWPDVHDFIDEANKENARNSTRAIGLVWGSMLETMFRSFLEQQLKWEGRPDNDLRYGNGKKCGENFESRINGAVAERFIDQFFADHLHAIRRIRNVCAHEWKLNYTNGNVSALVDDLNLLRSAYSPTFLPDDFDALIKMVYSAACGMIIIRLAERSIPDDHD